jgi:hypothetical protein
VCSSDLIGELLVMEFLVRGLLVSELLVMELLVRGYW